MEEYIDFDFKNLKCKYCGEKIKKFRWISTNDPTIEPPKAEKPKFEDSHALILKCDNCGRHQEDANLSDLTESDYKEIKKIIEDYEKLLHL
ncbi:MAG: hypothetical protein J6T16_04525 [Opitutales bacterium]|nr:hypothetical protein [Opitutales bacterium]